MIVVVTGRRLQKSGQDELWYVVMSKGKEIFYRDHEEQAEAVEGREA